MGGLNWVEMVSAILFVAVCAMAGTLLLMQRMEAIVRAERAYGLPAGHGGVIGGVIGGLAGFGVAFVGIYYYLFAEPGGGTVLWVGRFSYVLILSASAAHLTVLVHLWMRLDAEEEALLSEKGKDGTLTVHRQSGLEVLRKSRDSYADVRARDDDAMEELMGVFGERLLTGQRALGRIPFYGYLGTVCGILLMAEHLTRLDEATETFRVLRNMAGGLVLAFQTTLVSLLAYLPLRKTFDVLMNRMADLERRWLAMRDGIL
ncbi:MAG: MotA/TolQ/ExbB proton channel family protein [bacterium]|nr:MotA/TolQ/ExbB proton channel family protein [bacterium]